jgi:DNA-binding CsgD family transcriptional regulator
MEAQTCTEALFRKSPEMPHHELTKREIEVVVLLANGNRNKQAAAKMNLSKRTVEAHRKHVMKKLKFTSFSDLVKFAIRHGLVQLQPVISHPSGGQLLIQPRLNRPYPRNWVRYTSSESKSDSLSPSPPTR